MSPVFCSKVTRLAIAIVVAAAMCFVGYLVARIASEQGARKTAGLLPCVAVSRGPLP